MKTFADIKPKLTPKIIKRLVELVEGFEIMFETTDGIVAFRIVDSSKWYSIDSAVGFSTLLHRAVEGWNKLNFDGNLKFIAINTDSVSVWIKPKDVKRFMFEDYLPCHLTACEMAIADCLCEVLG